MHGGAAYGPRRAVAAANGASMQISVKGLISCTRSLSHSSRIRDGNPVGGGDEAAVHIQRILVGTPDKSTRSIRLNAS